MAAPVVILALDIGTTSGWAVRRACGRIESGRLPMKAGAHPGDRMRQFRAWLTDLSIRLELDGGVGRVVWEDAFRQPGHANAVHHRLVGVLLEWAARKGIPAVPVGVSAIKRHATGSGAADKAAMVAAAQAHAPGVADHNEADALLLLHYDISGGQGGAPRAARAKPKRPAAKRTRGAGARSREAASAKLPPGSAVWPKR